MEKQLKPTSGDFGIEIRGQSALVSRQFEFTDGDTLSFRITVPWEGETSVMDLHRASLQTVIDFLTEMKTAAQK